ncbi:2-succinyl-6-hydroxy-2,4-cyclohexadiene-1-carboxylate synthase [Jeotgalibacillus soli]|uniref:Putative 2-succinyl-6-hydroxy-2,4-cyclohexadiene-1-carboxylate synthase n=1 Tax=Jeotgalibacillus soli TaxID=889306 RepID=A0A0C2R0W8_9BACL|nr:2-succinyl-6-hydroxy-2,4-cyclohexadiene-1-carboxylate synthase [Jeotgalibacillus soli]KIL43950.1 esterase [Jeotgalibacillus soli]
MNLSIRDATYNIRVEGQGESILLLHGFTGDMSTWKHTIRTLSSKWKCVAVDLPGHGGTIMPDDRKRYSMKEVCRDLKEMLDALKIEKAHIAGYSMGGRTALSFAHYYPERVSTLILESGSPGLASPKERQDRIEADEKLAQFIEAEGIKAFVDKWENISLFKSQKNLSARIQSDIRTQRLKNHAAGLAESLRGMGTGSQSSWWDHLSTMKIPMLLLTGEEDEKFCQIADQMLLKLPHAKKVVFSEAGHAIHVEQPEKFDTMLMEFLLFG